jgi:hypothetical protein
VGSIYDPIMPAVGQTLQLAWFHVSYTIFCPHCKPAVAVFEHPGALGVMPIFARDKHIVMATDWLMK